MSDEVRLNVSFSTDDDGFLSQQCPSCERRFKVKFGEGSDQPIAFCPYCGHNEQGCWWTQQQADYLAAKASDEVVGPQIEKMARDFNRRSRRDDFVQVSMEVKRSPVPEPPVEHNDEWPTCRFDCCGEIIKHEGKESTLHCIICGKEHNL